MGTHTSILAWTVPWTEEPGRLQSMGHKESDMTENAHTQGNCATLSETCSDGIAIVIPVLFAFPNAPKSLSSFLVSLTLHMTVMYNKVCSLRF